MRGPFRGRLGVLYIAVFTAALVAISLAGAGRAQAQQNDWDLIKTANPTTYTAAGQVITYTYVIVNNRGQTDARQPDGRQGDDYQLSTLTPVPPAGLTCTGTYTTTAADVTAGFVTNHATATGNSCGDGCTVTAPATATVNFAANPRGR